MSSGAVRYTPAYSFEDYELWEGDWELWDGVPVSMSPSPVPRHQSIGLQICIALDAAVKDDKCDCAVVYETDWRLKPNTVVRPDIAVVCKGLPETFIDYPPALIVEVLSPSTQDKDRTAKKRLYEEQGVQIYLIADPQTNTIEASQLIDGEYADVPALDGVLSVQWNKDCRAEIRLKDVFAER